MPEANENKVTKAGPYEWLVQGITEWVKPKLHRRTQAFVARAVDEYAQGEPRFARMIEFEVRRRGDGAGLTQDVAEPLLWIGIKTAAALVIGGIGESFKNGKAKMVGWTAALVIMLNNGVELFRLVPRYTAGLQGSLEMAKDRWNSIKTTGVDPFNQQSSTREINRNPAPEDLSVAGTSQTNFTDSVAKKETIMPTTLMEQANRDSGQMANNGRS